MLRLLRLHRPPPPPPAPSAFPGLAVVGAAIERSVDAQERRIASLDQRGGVLLGFGGLLVTLVLSGARPLAWWGAISAGLAVASAACAASAIAPRSGDTAEPRALLERYSTQQPEAARFRVLSTVAAIFESEEEAARIKGRRLRWAIGLLLASVAVVLVGATLEALL